MNEKKETQRREESDEGLGRVIGQEGETGYNIQETERGVYQVKSRSENKVQAKRDLVGGLCSYLLAYPCGFNRLYTFRQTKKPVEVNENKTPEGQTEVVWSQGDIWFKVEIEGATSQFLAFHDNQKINYDLIRESLRSPRKDFAVYFIDRMKRIKRPSDYSKALYNCYLGRTQDIDSIANSSVYVVGDWESLNVKSLVCDEERLNHVLTKNLDKLRNPMD
jgi:hypothetical protein